MSLYRKYRPKDFPGLIGQEHIKVTLLNAIKAGNIAHAYLFTGPRGTGKTTTARLLAKAINAETMTEDGRFDGSEIAEEIDAGRLIDVIEIDAASNRGIDEIRDLREKINYAPTRAKNKVYIIDEVHMLTKEAFNALLKTLEEPPAFVYFILATTEINKVPETIISRCQRFDFRRITEDVLVKHLKQVAQIEEIEAEEEAIRIIAKHARGGARDALTLLEQITSGGKLETERVKTVLGISNYSVCEEILNLLDAGKTSDAALNLEQAFQAGVDLVQFNRDILDFLRQKLLEAVRLDDHGRTARLIDLIGYFQESYEKQKFSYIPELPLEVAIAKAGLKRELIRPEKIIRKEAAAESANRKPREDTAQSTTGEEPGLSTAAESVKKNFEPVMDAALADFMKAWPAIMERVQVPLAKRCLMAGRPLNLSGNNLELGFGNNFNKDKLFVPEMLAEVEKAIFEETGKNLRLSGKIVEGLVVETAVITSVSADLVETAATVKSPSAAAAKAASKKDQLMESALNVFGGEVVE